MGASNVAAAFQTYARVLRDHDKAMRLLVYMANVARDDDPDPWFGMGHAALAEHALGREPGDDGEVGASDLRAVRRAITTLLNVGAITVARPANGRRAEYKTVRYRLHLLAPATESAVDTDNPAGVHRRTLSGSTVGRSVVHRRTLSGPPWDGERPPKEEEENEERVEEEVVTSQGEVTTRAHANKQPEIGALVDIQQWAQRRANDNGEFRPRSSAEARRRAREVLAAALAARKGAENAAGPSSSPPEGQLAHAVTRSL